ncbi:MAG: hypothetical protein EHM70_09680 [Chloroflexota bacterium]|nr:MAG: hypothetical protein EHM70_09680 [Chloroflexota bacterium]
MKASLLKAQSSLVHAAVTVIVALFLLYLGFMTHYYALFYDGTMETLKYYKQLQVFNKEAFNLILQFIVFALILLAFELHKYRPGLFGLTFIVAMTGFLTQKSLLLTGVLPKYKRGYLALDFSEMENYSPSTFVFDAGLVLHYILIGLLFALLVVAIFTFAQRLREGKPLIRRLI